MPRGAERNLSHQRPAGDSDRASSDMACLPPPPAKAALTPRMEEWRNRRPSRLPRFSFPLCRPSAGLGPAPPPPCALDRAAGLGRRRRAAVSGEQGSPDRRSPRGLAKGPRACCPALGTWAPHPVSSRTLGQGGAIVRLGSSGVTREPGGEEGREGAISRGLVWDPHPPWQDEQVFFFFY